jgi:large subunit ribosomal protein L30
MAESTRTLKLKLVRSPIGGTERQRATVRALGLRKLQQVVEHADSPVTRGMINKVAHLVHVVEED